MCGIHGFTFEDKDLVHKMMRASAHRGPDDSGLYVGEGVSLGHNRLSIIDLSEKGRQPMWSADKRLAIVFNGEIYNFKALRQELESKGHSFVSQSDTEVILLGYREWGANVVSKLNGIFAFAIWDGHAKEFFLVRDPLGVKPLYYYHNDGEFLFSSEIKSILEHTVPRKLNKEAFNLYLAASYVPGSLTLFENIYKLLPGHYAIVRGGAVQTVKYWDVNSSELLGVPRSEIAKSLREKVIRAVHGQLVSDRPLGVYLSGGIDSSIVLSCMKQARADIDTFSVGFEVDAHEEPEKFNADFELARKSAEYFGTNHHEVRVSSDDVIELLEEAIWHMDEPISNPTAVAMYKLAQFTKPAATVVLGGDGGDELFAGYDYYKLNKAADIFHKFPAPLRSLFAGMDSRLRKLNTPVGADRYGLFMLRNRAEVEGYAADFDFEKAREYFEGHYFSDTLSTSADALMSAHRKSWLVDHSLMLTDKMSMASAVEVRVPLLAKEVVEYAARIPARYKASLWDTKIILKEAFKNDIPHYLLDQPKRGWFSPGAKWLRHEKVHALVGDVLRPDYYSETATLFNWNVLQEMLESHRHGEYYRIPLWSVLTFQLWAKKFNVKP